MIDKKKIKILKKRITEESDFLDLYNYFFDHFGENQTFLDESIRIENEALQTIIVEVAKKVLGLPLVVADLLLLEVAEFKIVHGTAIMNSKLLTFFFFKDITVGLVAIALEGETQFARISPATLQHIFPSQHDSSVIN